MGLEFMGLEPQQVVTLEKWFNELSGASAADSDLFEADGLGSLQRQRIIPRLERSYYRLDAQGTLSAGEGKAMLPQLIH